MDDNEVVSNALIAECERRLIDESLPRIKKCLGLLTEHEIWHRPNDETVSVGNLVLHLCGNVRQWLLCGLGNQPDHRDRDREFAQTVPVPTSQLIDMLEDTLSEVKSLLSGLTAQRLTEVYTVQGFSENGVAILVHVVEHFSYHTGQITYYVKSRKNISTDYYAGVDLNQK